MPMNLPSLRRCLVLCVCFFVMTGIAYGSSLNNEFVDWDDRMLIRDNPIVASFNLQTIKKAFTSYDPELYIPVTFLSYQIDHLIAGLDPFIYHFTNVVLHTFNALLVAWFLFLLLENGWIALGLGLLFALHPLNTEAAMWASSRKDVLSTFFFFGSLVSYLLGQQRQKQTLYWLSLLSFVVGLMSKVMIITLPIVLLLLDGARGKLNKQSFINIIPFALFSVIFGVIGVMGKTKILVASTLWQKILMACKSTIFYLQKFFWPEGLSVLYPYTKNIEFIDFAVPFFSTIILILVGLFLWKRNKLASFGILFYLITLAPTFLNFAKGGDIYFASDRYAYIPIVGVLLLLGIGMRYYTENASTVRSVRFRQRAGILFFIIILSTSTVLSNAQAHVWKNTESLFNHTLHYYKNSHTAYNNIGMVLYGRGETDAAIEHLQKAIQLKPDPLSWNNLAAAKVQKGLQAEAEKIYRDVLVMDPKSTDAHYGIGNLYQKQNKFQDAIQQYKKTLEIDPTYFNAYNNLGVVYIFLEDWKHAAEILEKSTKLKPGFAESQYNLGIVYLQMGETAKAEEAFRTTISINPRDADAYAHLAKILYQKKNIDETATYLKQALMIEPSNPTAFALLLEMQKDGYITDR